MQYVGIDWAYRRASWCALSESGAIARRGPAPHSLLRVHQRGHTPGRSPGRHFAERTALRGFSGDVDNRNGSVPQWRRQLLICKSYRLLPSRRPRCFSGVVAAD
jgi:hypothetical protein